MASAGTHPDHDGDPSRAGYLERHRHRLRELFGVLGEDWPGGDTALLHHMETRWLGAEHGPGGGKRTFDEGTRSRAWPLLRELEVVDRADPPRAAYDQVIVMGATSIGLYRRLGLVRHSGVTAASLTVLAGLRPHNGLPSDGALDELLATDGRFAAADGWTPPPLAVHQAALLGDLDPLTAARIVMPSETDLARLFLGKHWPDARLDSVAVDTAPGGVRNELGGRAVVLETYRAGGTIPLLRVLNGAPVRRDLDATPRPARPTSRSTIREWVELAAGGARSMLVVVNQPHLTRVRLDVVDELAKAGVRDLHIDVAGAQALRDSADLNLLLGEIPARINAERITGRTSG
ncbi:hypothetical protein [Parafrankia sp. EUN1f]|uniref:hypothetical protein n=1 Tax=Parafrankia sp. EUN1f TaxID=102897 RepID=UPI0001C474B7|nr:hypothetical protein [Parafrankia sp. EUN1f]EFC79869.1 hypothetical protein FrEUN1fDRAFT_7015 [Parafrankia sp. EUN1f]